MPIVVYLLAIIVCGATGALGGFAFVRMIGLEGTPGALIAAFVGMVGATALWVVGAAIFHPRKRG